MPSAGFGAIVRSPSVALVILALGLGANTALFSVTNAVLLRPLPFPAPDRLVVLRLFDPEFQGPYPSFPVNAAHIAVWRERCASCEDLAAINAITTTLTGGGEAEQLDGASVSASFFELLGITPVFGRGFRAGRGQRGAERRHGHQPCALDAAVRRQSVRDRADCPARRRARRDRRDPAAQGHQSLARSNWATSSAFRRPSMCSGRWRRRQRRCGRRGI